MLQHFHIPSATAARWHAIQVSLGRRSECALSREAKRANAASVPAMPAAGPLKSVVSAMTEKICSVLPDM